MSRKVDADDDGARPSADRTARHLGDQKLRHHYFRIHSRPRSGSNLWVRGGSVFTEREAHETRLAEIRAAAANAMKGSR